MSCFDGQYTKVAKPTASYTVVTKGVATYTITAKTTATYTVVEEPCYELLCLLTEDGVPILHEDGRMMVREG